MKLLWTFVFMASYCVNALAAGDLRGITEDGRKVILSNDGRWRFDDRAPIKLTPESSPYQSRINNFSLVYDESKWSSSKDKEDESSGKKIFKHKTLPLYGVVVVDEIPANTASIKAVVIHNAKNASVNGDVKVILDETRKINGKDVGSIRFAASLENIDFMFDGNYYGDDNGNIQVMCYTGQSVFFKYKEECEKFISGLRIK